MVQQAALAALLVAGWVGVWVGGRGGGGGRTGDVTFSALAGEWDGQGETRRPGEGPSALHTLRAKAQGLQTLAID